MLREKVIQMLKDRGVELKEIAEIVYKLQSPFNPDLTMEECLESVERVMDKREVHHTVMTGIALDMAAENNALPEPLLTIIKNDEPLYGVDESLAVAIASIYGTIGFTSFGYLDKNKIGVMARLDDKNNGQVHCFLDDIIAGIASAASARLAHSRGNDIL
ncbi:phosphatidylglycerophosphatase [Anoxybacter fermentans]|uniref:Phosphatidylglycerophosphatase n=1 Tax=Anoxybacter fermentans TaxID=1323375 RepID=A0A3Q9HSE3_9FIRM|nr:phosphatidylglycerophosphatase A [Anoxybacter fermentans]AZR74616.1 phosphatidylglycerophosphatase [Anoxybacter fermentans]